MGFLFLTVARVDFTSFANLPRSAHCSEPRPQPQARPTLLREMEFARRFSHTSEMLQATTSKDARQPLGLHVDTNNNNRSPKAPKEPQQDSSPMTSPVLGPRSAPSSTHHEDTIRRRRSHSECLLLAKTNGSNNLPGPCQEYISNVKQILARNDDQLMQLKRRRSMNLSHPSLFK